LLLLAVISLFGLWRWKRGAQVKKELEFIFFADENRQLDKSGTQENRK
jgi:hypothetical protein